MEVTFAHHQWIKNLQNGRLGQVVETLPGGYTGAEMIRVKLLDGICIWSAARLWTAVKEGGQT